MFSLFNAFILRRVSPELTDVYIFTLETLQRFYGDSVIEFSEQLVEQTKEESTEDVIDRVAAEFKSYLVKAIKQFGVRLDEESLDNNSISLLTSILHGLLELEAYEDTEQLLGVIESSDSSTDILVNLLPIVTGEYLDYISVIIEVNPDLIYKLKSIILDNLDTLPNDDFIDINPALQLFIEKGYGEYCNKDIGKSLTSRPHRLSLSRILRLYGNRIADENQWANWLLVILVAKEYNQPELLFSEWENYFLEPDTIIDMKHKVMNAFNTLMED